ncbi:MAG: Sua5/YciO/YrdC/YwlC family protein [Marinagarivorans sp.]|nr:Sua5/YciO/YrdC/YwlC family protein [Marinagarivorans sp.]
MFVGSQTRIHQLAINMACGDVIAYPTEAVWGLGCDPFNGDAVAKILRLKKRAVKKGVILIAGNIQQLAFLLHDLPAEQLATLRVSWPGPYTWLVPHNDRVPFFVRGNFDTVAVRVTNHPTVQALCNAFGGPIVSTSANPQGLPPATTALKARSYFGTKIGYCPGVVGKNKTPSQIKHLLTGDIIRPA